MGEFKEIRISVQFLLTIRNHTLFNEGISEF